MTTTDWKNQLYFGDNLDILRITSPTPALTSSTSTRPSTPTPTTTSSSRKKAASSPPPRSPPSKTPGTGTSIPRAPTRTS